MENVRVAELNRNDIVQFQCANKKFSAFQTAMVDQFSDANLMYEAWRILRSQLEGESKQKMLEIENNLGIDVDKELENMYERSMEWRTED